MAAPTSLSEWASEWASMEVMDGAGIIGDSIGVADTQLLAAAGTTPGATRFITGTPTTEAGAQAAEFPAGAASTQVGVRAAEFPPRATSTEVEARAAEFITVPAQRSVHSTGTGRRREDTLRPAVRPAFAPAPSAASRRADRQKPIRLADKPASVAEQPVAVAEYRVVAVAAEGPMVAAVVAAEDRVVAVVVVGIINQESVRFLVARKTWKWR